MSGTGGRRQRCTYPAMDFDYNNLLTILDDNWQGWETRARFNPDDLYLVWRRCRQALGWPFSGIVTPARVRGISMIDREDARDLGDPPAGTTLAGPFRFGASGLALNAEGKGYIASTPPLSAREFSTCVYDYLVTGVRQFIALPEPEKTARLFHRFAGIKVRFTNKRFSWIPRPDMVVLSAQTDFTQVNRLLLTTSATGPALRNLLVYRTGLVFASHLWTSPAMRRDIAEPIRELIYHLRLAPAPVLLRKYATSVGLVPGQEVVFGQLDFPLFESLYLYQVLLRWDDKDTNLGSETFTLTVRQSTWAEETHQWVLEPEPLSSQQFKMR